MKSPLKVRYHPSHGWEFTIREGEKRSNFRGFRTDLQAYEARKLVLRLISEQKPVPTAGKLRKIVPEYLEEAEKRGTQIRITMRERRKVA